MMGRHGVIIAGIVVGVALETGIHVLSGRREAWDSPEFWTIGIPGALVASIAIGFLSRSRNWIWTLVIVPSQVTTMIVRSEEIGGLWPLAVVLSSVLSVPFVIAAFVGSRFRSTR
jgi:hypothetical protein